MLFAVKYPPREEPSMRKQHVVVLSEQERARLHTLIGQGSASARALTHARILLKAGQGEAGPGWTDRAIATALEVCHTTVARVRQQYAAGGLEAAVHRKAPEREYRRKLDGEQEAHLVVLACSAPPEGRKRKPIALRGVAVRRTSQGSSAGDLRCHHLDRIRCHDEAPP
jgi:Winged helix-turn helix